VRRLRRVLHATDFSRASQRAFGQAVDMAQQNKAELWLLHVLTPVTNYVIGEYDTDPTLYARLDESAYRDAQAALSALTQRAEKAKIKVTSKLVRGTPQDQILQVAKSSKADMIVIGTHGRTGLSKLFMGSVAGKVVSAATCPVLTVRGN
jgi:universal stress protein A